MIEFLCPNGHKIRCQGDQAGRAAKCPRCGVRFRIPDAADLDVLGPTGSDSGTLSPEFSDSVVTSQRTPPLGPGMAREPQIEFLCPNGHHLHGAASLQGKPGECPECGSRFRIPSYEDISADEEAERNLGVGRINDQGIALGDRDAGDTRSVLAARSRGPRDETATPSVFANRLVPGQGMAALVARLWELRTEDATLEIRLRDGETIVPDQFLKKLSQQTRQGVFAVKQSDESLALTVVAWDAIARATLRGLHELPKGLSE